jgi:predicted dehydrogenase
MVQTRRSFLGAAAGAAGALLVPSCAARPSGRPRRPPGEKLRLLVVGVGNRGAENLAAVAGEEIAWLCDVDRGYLDAAAKLHPAARTAADWRAVLESDAAIAGLDAVVVSTPDHSHYPVAVRALQRGLDVYCEKPLTHTVTEARRLRDLAARHGAVTQMGTQIHANANYRRVVEAIRAGAVGTVREVVVFVNGTDWSAEALPPADAPPPHLDFDLWLGAAAACDYSGAYHPMGWRRYWAFGGGTTADMGCHFMDLPFWALGLDAPVSLRSDGPEPHAACAPRGMRCEYVFAAVGARAAVTLRWHAGGDRPEAALAGRGLQGWRNGVLFVGDDGWLISDYSRHAVGPAARAASWRPPAPSLAESPGHHAEWIRACKERTQPSCSFAYAAPLTETVLLANVAYRAARGQRLRWDAAAMCFDDAAAANALLDAPARAGFAV